MNKIKDLQDAYDDGFQNGISFAYIPEEMTHEQTQEWGRGYKDALVRKNHERPAN